MKGHSSSMTSLWSLGCIVLSTLSAVTNAQSIAGRPRITGVSHLSAYSSDRSKTESFYVHDLGAVKRDDPENPAGVRYYFSPIQFVEILPLPAGYTSINRLDHVAFNTDNAEALRGYIGAHGIEVPAQVQKGSDGSKWFEILDPEGNKVEFVQPPAHPAAVPVNPLSSHIIHVGYMVHSADAENKLYRDLLGFRPYWYGGGSKGGTAWISQQVPDGSDWIEYMLANSPETKGIPADMTAEHLGALNHFSLGVPNMESAVNLLWNGDRLNARHSPPQIGRDAKWQINIYDPDGTRSEIMELQPIGKPCCSDFTAPSPTK